MTARLEELGDRVEVQWGLPMVSSLDALDDRIPETLEREVCHLVPRPW